MVLLLVTGKPVWGFDRLMSPRKVADWLHSPICNKNACGCEKDTQTKLIYATMLNHVSTIINLHAFWLVNFDCFLCSLM